MQWTNEKPQSTPNGTLWYWRRWKPNEQVEITRIQDGRVWFTMGGDKGWPIEEVEGEWAGPLSPPQ